MRWTLVASVIGLVAVSALGAQQLGARTSPCFAAPTALGIIGTPARRPLQASGGGTAATSRSSRFSLQRSVPSEKESRTPAQRKINSQLLYEIYRLRGQAAQKNVPPGKTGVKIDEKQRALVDVRADVTPELQKKIGALGGTIESTFPEYRSIIVWMPLLKLEQLAQDPAVYAIVPLTDNTFRRP